MLGYCTNVFPGDTFDSVIKNLEEYVKPLQHALSFDAGIGIWLSANALHDADVTQLKDTLEQCGVQLMTCNGFPAGNFHAERVRHDVYLPNWSMDERLEYTQGLAELCAAVTHRQSFGISTLPLGWNVREFDFRIATTLILKCIDSLEEIEQKSGVCIHLDIEAEPGCLLQTSAELSQFVNEAFGDDERVRRYLRVCHDTCHAAVMQEPIESCIKHYEDSGLSIGKVQVSSALQCEVSDSNKDSILQGLSQFNEPKFLHQTTVQDDNSMLFYEHLEDALISKATGLWRVHFHVPIHKSSLGFIQTTQDDLLHSINVLKTHDIETWEVETYTWNEMPSTIKRDELVESMAKELHWARDIIYN